MEALTAEQQALVDRPIDARTFVVAGPGTGKTHTLAARAQALLDSDEVDEEHRILVLGFTRAAVAEIRARMSGHEGAASVIPTTVDALARRLVREGSGELGGGFDAVVKAAQTLLAGDDDDFHVAHVIVDEAQDLEGIRRDFVAALLERASGFTVLGDPAQGIYGFQRDSAATEPMTDLRARFPDADVVELTVDHRVRAPTASLVAWARTDLMKGGGSELRATLRRALREAPRVSERSLALALRNSGSETAVLCRSNGDVLALSEFLREAGVPHRIQSAADVHAPPRWVADLLKGVEGDLVDEEAFRAVAGAMSGAQRQCAWDGLRRVAGEDRNDVSLPELRRSLGRLETREVPGASSNLPLLSTVHRAKGLEFDRVFISEFSGGQDIADDLEEARVLFVAMTRARDETLMVERPRASRAIRKRAGRWLATPWQRNVPTSVEVRVGDVDRETPLMDEGSAAFSQRHLATSVHDGDEVTLERRSRFGRTAYVVVHKGVEIGALGAGFTNDLDRLEAAPAEITGLAVKQVSTAAGDPEFTEAAGIGPAGFWLVPEVVGFGHLR